MSFDIKTVMLDGQPFSSGLPGYFDFYWGPYNWNLLIGVKNGPSAEISGGNKCGRCSDLCYNMRLYPRFQSMPPFVDTPASLVLKSLLFRWADELRRDSSEKDRRLEPPPKVLQHFLF